MLKYKQQRDKEEQARNKNSITTTQSAGKSSKPSQPDEAKPTNIASFFGVKSDTQPGNQPTPSIASIFGVASAAPDKRNE